MPNTRLERLIALCGLLVVLVVAGLTVWSWLDYRSSAPAETTPAFVPPNG